MQKRRHGCGLILTYLMFACDNLFTIKYLHVSIVYIPKMCKPILFVLHWFSQRDHPILVRLHNFNKLVLKQSVKPKTKS